MIILLKLRKCSVVSVVALIINRLDTIVRMALLPFFSLFVQKISFLSKHRNQIIRSTSFRINFGFIDSPFKLHNIWN